MAVNDSRLIEDQIKKEASKKFQDDGRSYIFPADETAFGSNFAPKSGQTPDPEAINNQLQGQINEATQLPSTETQFVSQEQAAPQREVAAVPEMAPTPTSPQVESIPQVDTASFDNYGNVVQDIDNRIAQINEQRAAAIQKKIDEDAENVDKIEPKGFFEGKSTWQKILGGIGMFLGSITPEGARNVASIIEKEINRDIEAQKMNIKLRRDKQNASYEKMLQKYGSQEAALLAKKKTAYEMLDLHMKKLEATARNAETRARISLGREELQLKKDSLRQDLMKELLKQQEKVQEGSIPGYQGTIKDPVAAREFRAKVSEMPQVIKEIDNLLKINDQFLGGALSTDARASATQSQNLLLGKLREAIVGPGTMSETDRDILEDAIANPTSFFTLSSSNKIKLERLKSAYKNKLEADARAYGLQKATVQGARKL